MELKLLYVMNATKLYVFTTTTLEGNKIELNVTSCHSKLLMWNTTSRYGSWHGES